MNIIHHHKPAQGKPTYLKVRFDVLDNPPRIEFRVLEQDERLRDVWRITDWVHSTAFPQIVQLTGGNSVQIYLRGNEQQWDARAYALTFSCKKDRNLALRKFQQALIDAEPRIIEICEG
jgi:hypothetical protein